MSRLALCLIVQEIGGGHPDQGLPGWGGPVDPGYGRPGGGGRPDQGLPWFPGRPDQGLPGGGGHPDQGLPWAPGRPDQGLPGGGRPGGGRPDQGLPGGGGIPTLPIYQPPSGTKPTPPGQSPGPGLWVVAYVPNKGFQWVAISPGVPEKPTPGDPPGSPDQGLPQPPTATPKG